MSEGLREPAKERPSVVTHVARLLMVASGFAGLGYQIVWTEQSSLWLGHESASVLAVVTAFFGGLSLGGLLMGPRIERSPRPLAWYVGCELVVAAWSLLLVFLGAPFSVLVMRATGVQPSPSWQWTMALCSTLLLFLPATAAMGATLPAMERLTTAMKREGRSIADLYACNTLGAVLGVLSMAFGLVPALGLARSTVVCVALNVACAAAAFFAFPRGVMTPNLADERSPHAPARKPVTTSLAVTGFLGIGFEIVVVRVLSQITENTVYTFAMLLAVYLVGGALGAAGYRRLRDRRRSRGQRDQRAERDQGADGAQRAERDHGADRDELRQRDALLAALATSCLLGSASLWNALFIKGWLLSWVGKGMTSALLVEAALAVLAFGPATVVMGALFSHLSDSAHAAGTSFGRALGINMLAATAAPMAFGTVLVPILGAKWALLLIVAGYLLLLVRRSWPAKTSWVPVAAILGAALFAPPLIFVDIPEGGHLTSYSEGILAAVSVVEDAQGVARLRINNRQQEGSSRTRKVDARQAWLPLLLHTAPKHALFLGLGSGVTASSAAEEPTLEVDVVELLPEVVAAAGAFAQPNARLHVIAADARRFVRATGRRYDVIVSDNFHPARSGSGALYTVEHFEAVAARLAPGGVFCQWLPLHQLDLATLGSIVRSFVAVYPKGWALLANNSLETPVVGLVAREGAARFDIAALQERLVHPGLLARMTPLGLEDEYAVLGSFVAGPRALERFASSAALNTDDRPIVMYQAPRITYAPSGTPSDRLGALLGALSIDRTELLLPGADPNAERRLVAYWRARDRFIEMGKDVKPLPRVEDMLLQVREPLLSVLRVSPEFRPAYDPLLSMATALARSDKARARDLLAELARLQPARSEAPFALAMLGERDEK